MARDRWSLLVASLVFVASLEACGGRCLNPQPEPPDHPDPCSGKPQPEPPFGTSGTTGAGGATASGGGGAAGKSGGGGAAGARPDAGAEARSSPDAGNDVGNDSAAEEDGPA